jgi:hypothetical protein
MPRVLLALIYFLLVTPYGLVRRLLRDPLARRLDPDSASYLVRTDPT